MSAELTKARNLINSVSTFLKQAKPTPAVSALFEALHIVLREPLIRAEKTEFSTMIQQAVMQLNKSPALRRVYPLIINYTPGEDKALLETLRELSQTLKAEAVDEARDQLADLQKRRSQTLEQGRQMLGEQRFDDARQLFAALVKDFPDDATLRSDIAELFMQHELYEDAFNYLDQALDLSPDQIHLYNRIGIALRKLKRFDVAEKYFMRAVGYAKSDPNLYFNLGRVYVDWGRWDRVERAAKLALKLNPQFEQAQKMLNFALNKQGRSD
jgi:predicted Zn-dependent protease